MTFKQEILDAIQEAVSSGARQYKACEVIGLVERRYRRWKHSVVDQRVGGYRAKNQRITDSEKKQIVAQFTSDEHCNLPPRVAHATLMDKGVYIASASSCIRILKKESVLKVKENNQPKRVRPELKATGPNQVWSWDVTWLPSNVKGKYFYLYLIIDMYSRYVVDWAVHSCEDSFFARQLFARAFEYHEVNEEKPLVVHADNGQMMRSKMLNELFNSLSINASHSRPHTSNDNAFSESIFATLKGRVLYPECFLTVDSAELFSEQFVEWYNFSHKHSGIEYLSPYEVHENCYEDVLHNRNKLLELNRNAHPERHGNKNKRYKLPDFVELKHKVTFKKSA